MSLSCPTAVEAELLARIFVEVIEWMRGMGSNRWIENRMCICQQCKGRSQMGWLSIDRGRRAVKVCVCMECVYYIDVYDEIKPFE